MLDVFGDFQFYRLDSEGRIEVITVRPEELNFQFYRLDSTIIAPRVCVDVVGSFNSID